MNQPEFSVVLAVCDDPEGLEAAAASVLARGAPRVDGALRAAGDDPPRGMDVFGGLDTPVKVSSEGGELTA